MLATSTGTTASGLGTSYLIATGNFTPLGITTGDFNRDGRMDVAWSTPAGNLVQALNTNGTGFIWSISTIATMSGITRIKVDDMDQRIDLGAHYPRHFSWQYAHRAGRHGSAPARCGSHLRQKWLEHFSQEPRAQS